MDKSIKCKCSACAGVKTADRMVDLPLRYNAEKSQAIFSFSLFLAIPFVGSALITKWPWATVPWLGFFLAYLANAFFLCSNCSYHHDNVRLCGCFPKSIFPYKRYTRWGRLENNIGWPLIGGLLFVPTIAVLAWKSQVLFIALFIFLLMMVILLQSTFSCPNCRQRSVCYLGIATLFIKQRHR